MDSVYGVYEHLFSPDVTCMHTDMEVDYGYYKGDWPYSWNHVKGTSAVITS